MRTSRSWSIRAKIISLLLVPLITLIVMWVLATAVTIGPGVDIVEARSNAANIGRPIQALVAELQAERKLSLLYIAGGRKDSAALTAQRTKTDGAAAAFRQGANDERAAGAVTDVTAARLTDLTGLVNGVAALRGRIDRGEIDRTSTLRAYAEVVDAGFLVRSALIRAADDDLARESHGLIGLGRARELLAREDALLAAAFAAGTIAAPDLSQATQLVGAQRFAIAETLPDLFADDRAEYQALATSDAFARLAAMENRLVADARAGAPVPVDAATWQTAYDAVSTQLQALDQRAADRLVDRSGPAATVIFAQIAVAGVLGLVTVVITIIASIRIARSLIKRLAGLRQAALELAVDRLPRVVTRLRAGDEVDVEHEAPPLPYGDDEIGQVGHAFNELQRTAINSAVEEANVRRGINEVFLNIARRSQTLLHRQLAILDRMERRADDPTELEDLFRVDHLATRMRRHAEDLVILAGAAPGRGWRNPITIMDVLRGAVSEVEDYARVAIRPMPELSVAGRAVGDVIHLLAELIENATSFSPPHTRVDVRGEVVTHGFAIEIEDRGLGIGPAALVEFNSRLADPPEFDPANSAQLGLFVVARLAERHGVKVQLKPSPYGGITAVALLPDDLIAGVPRAVAALPAGPLGAAQASADGIEANRTDPNGGDPRGDADVFSDGQTWRPVIESTIETITDSTVDDDDDYDADADADADAPLASSVRSAPRHARREIIEAPVSAGAEGLPKRVRQTSLAPQLRDNPAASGDIPTQAQPTRSPEELRAMMTSFQAGMARGRRDADDGSEAGAAERDGL